MKQWRLAFMRRAVLRSVVKTIHKKEDAWERGRFQRQFDYMSQAFEIWRVRTDEKRDLLMHYQALQHYRMSLLLRTMRWLRARLRIGRGLNVLWRA